MTALQGNEWVEGFSLLEKKIAEIEKDEKEADKKEKERKKKVFVDVGGGHGHQCSQLLKKFPTLKGKVVLQDLEEVVSNVQLEGVGVQVHDFFESQGVKGTLFFFNLLTMIYANPILGASFYYLRRILHDWPDSSCIKILKNLADAMTTDSRILIDEVVLPDFNVHWEAAMADIAMAIQFASRERTKKQWEDLVEGSGLRIELIHTYNATGYNSIIVLQLK